MVQRPGALFLLGALFERCCELILAADWVLRGKLFERLAGSHAFRRASDRRVFRFGGWPWAVHVGSNRLDFDRVFGVVFLLEDHSSFTLTTRANSLPPRAVESALIQKINGFYHQG